MNNIITTVLATLVHLGIITKEEGQKLDTELQTSTLPDSYEAAYQMLKTIFEKTDMIRNKVKLPEIDRVPKKS